MSKHFFIMRKADDGDAVDSLHIGGGETVLNVSADSVVGLLKDRDDLQAANRMLVDALDRERGRIRKLMRALADEICTPA